MKWGMNGLGILMMLTLISAARAEPSGLLNDTGQTQCLNVAGTALEECTPENSGDTSPYPGQDGRYGRDAAAKYPEQSGFTKPEGSGGHGGFAFTPLDVNGNPIPLVGDPPVPAETPRCVWDRVTNLIWEVKTDDGGLQDKDWTYGWGGYNTGTCFGNQSPSGCGTTNYNAALNTTNLCPFRGTSGWRLPTRRELLSIIDRNQYSPLIDIVFFPNTRSYPYWSADANALYPGKAWYVSFETGSSQFLDQAIDPFSVRLVRSGPGGIPPNQNFIENGDGTITDVTTGLMWDQCSWGQIWSTGPACDGSASAYEWSQSLLVPKTANSLLWRGYNDWRLPNPSELESLVKIDSWNPSIDKAVFPNTPSWWFWTSAVNAASFGSAHGVVFDSGAVSAYNSKPSLGNHVRLVRGGKSLSGFDPNYIKKPVTPIIIADNKTYDGTTAATIKECELDGISSGQSHEQIDPKGLTSAGSA